MKIKTINIVFLIIILNGCAQSGGVKYYYGDYSKTLYALKEDPSDDTELRHLEELQEIIDKSNEDGMRTPPGIQAELGYKYAKQGDMDKARELLNGEKISYPESQFFIDRLQRMLEE
jgi:hypothetical protein